MYIQEMRVRNFRCFGQEEVIRFRKGLNVLVGENDSGKSAIIDAIRIVLGTTDEKWYRIVLTDIYNENKDAEINIILKFVNLTESEQAAFLECLSYESIDGEEETPCLYINWTCKYSTKLKSAKFISKTSTGENGQGPELPVEARELLRVTYLRPLRDAYSDLRAGRNSRLSQIIQGIPDVDEGIEKYEEGVNLEDLSISGIAELSNHLLANHPKLKEINDQMNQIMNDQMVLNGDSVSSSFEVAGADSSDDKRLISLLEKLDVIANSKGGSGKIGLGTSNILSMACELLLDSNEDSSFLLIEEPEAHIHAQRQLRLIQSLQSEADKDGVNHQIIITTHSPIMASVVHLENISIVKNAKVFSLEKGKTKLDAEDYQYLERYLDATKANFFFAKSVMIVEGPSEELLIPTIAKLLGRDFTEYGVSVVNVRGTGLGRYARIFQRADNEERLDIKVACVTDCDIMPDCAPGICIDSKYENPIEWPDKLNRNWRVERDFTEQNKSKYLQDIQDRADGQQIKTFISDHWTLEYDLAYGGLADELIEAISECAYSIKNQSKKKEEMLQEYRKMDTQEEKASYLYSFFYGKNARVSKAEVAQRLAFILEKNYKQDVDALLDKIPIYIKKAINYVTIGEG